MFGMGFMEILLIAIIAVVALGPDKLPNAMLEMAKFVKKFKSGIEDAKSTLDNELNINDLKEEANTFKAQLEETKTSLTMQTKNNLSFDDIIDDDLKQTNENKQEEKISFKKKIKNKDKSNTNVNETSQLNVKHKKEDKV